MTKEEIEEWKRLVQKMVQRGCISFKHSPAAPWNLKNEPKAERERVIKTKPVVNREHFAVCPACHKNVFIKNDGRGRVYCDHFGKEGRVFCDKSGDCVE